VWGACWKFDCATEFPGCSRNGVGGGHRQPPGGVRVTSASRGEVVYIAILQNTRSKGPDQNSVRARIRRSKHSAINAIAPGAIAHRKWFESFSPGGGACVIRSFRCFRVSGEGCGAEPTEIAAAVLYLASGWPAQIHNRTSLGYFFFVDGGFVFSFSLAVDKDKIQTVIISLTKPTSSAARSRFPGTFKGGPWHRNGLWLTICNSPVPACFLGTTPRAIRTPSLSAGVARRDRCGRWTTSIPAILRTDVTNPNHFGAARCTPVPGKGLVIVTKKSRFLRRRQRQIVDTRCTRKSWSIRCMQSCANRGVAKGAWRWVEFPGVGAN